MDTLIEFVSEIDIGKLLKNLALLIGGLSCFVEFSKIKLNPLSWILNWVGKAINGPLIAKIDALDQKQDAQQATMDALRDTQDDNEIDRIRWEILYFARSCRNGEWHATDEFDHVMGLNAKYHRLLERRNLKNGIIDLEYNYILQNYDKCQNNSGNS